MLSPVLFASPSIICFVFSKIFVKPANIPSAKSFKSPINPSSFDDALA